MGFAHNINKPKINIKGELNFNFFLDTEPVHNNNTNNNSGYRIKMIIAAFGSSLALLFIGLHSYRYFKNKFFSS